LREYAVRRPAGVANELFCKDGRNWLRSVLPGLPRLVGLSIKLELDLLDSYERSIDLLDKEMAALAADDSQIQLMMSIPGVNYWGAFAIKAEVGDINRFQAPKQLTSYAGLVPRVHQSGGRCATGRITRRGRSNLRWIAVECGLSAARYDPKLAEFHKRVKRRSRMAAKAKVAVGRKLLELLWHILRSGKPYSATDSKKYGKKLSALTRQAKPEKRAKPREERVLCGRA
jgi:transposase